MADRRDYIIMKVKMPLSSVSFYLFILTLLDVAVKSQMSSNSNSHSFIQDNSDVRYLVDNIPVSVQKEFSSSPGVRVHNGKDSIAVYSSAHGGGGTTSSASSSKSGSTTTNGASGATSSISKAHLKFEPAILDFKERHLGMPHHEKVTILNLDRNKTIHMTSISGSTVHFHSSFFEDKIIPPLGNTSFNVVFLGREEGNVESCLYIHTSEGSFKYEVKGASIQSPYRLRPLSGVRLPLNASYSPLIQMHNPHSTTLQLVEVYSSGGEFHLELPSGELEGPKHLWEIPAFLTKPVIRVQFQARAQKNYTAYIRLKVNNSEEVLVVPLEVEVSSSAGLYCPDDVIDFGIGGSQDPPKQMKLMLRNSWKKPIRIQNIISTPVSKSLKIDFEPVKVPPDMKSATHVATLTFDWQTGLESGLMSGRIVVKSKQGNQKLVIPYTATVLIGGLLFDKQITKFRSDLTESYVESRPFYLTNSYKVPVAITNVTLCTCEDDCGENSLDGNAAVNFQLDDFVPVILQPNEKKKILELSIKRGVTLPPDLKLESKLFVQSNISTLSVPLLCYDGRLDMAIHSTSNETELHLGMVGSESIKEAIIAVINSNPVPVTLNSWGTSLTGGTVRLITMMPGNKTTFLTSGGTVASYQENYTSTQSESIIHPKHFAVFHLEVLAGQSPGLLDGSIWIRTEFETIKIHTSFEIQHGSLIVEPQPILFNNCFPGKICMEPLTVRSYFTIGMTVTGVSPVPPDRRFSYTASSPFVAPSSTSHLGLLSWDAEEGDFSYLGIKNNTVGWVQPDLGSTTDLPAYTKETDLSLLTERYNSFINMSSQPLNLSLSLDTTQVRDFKFKASIKLTWPRLMKDNKDHIRFPLTQVGNISLEDILIVNPATRHSLLIQIVLETGYPMANGILNNIPEKLRPFCTDYTSTNSDEFFIVVKEGYISYLSSQMLSSTSSFSGRYLQSLILSKREVSFLIPPASNVSLTLGFLPTSAQQSSALLFIRNNLTILELVQLSGVGAYTQFKFGNRRPGSATPLLFELADKHLRDCEREKHKKYPAPNLTVKRSFTARNTGALPITIHGFHISGLPCEGYGFRVLNCEPLNLPPNSTRKVDIAFTPDFTLARVQRTLSIWMSNEAGSAANYTLVATLPPYLLATCSSVLARPTWEPLLYYSAVTFMVFLLVCVLAAAFLESDRVLKHALLAMSQDTSVQPVLDLRLVAAGFNQSSNNNWNGNSEQQVKVNDSDVSTKKRLLSSNVSNSGSSTNSVSKRNSDGFPQPSESCTSGSNINLFGGTSLSSSDSSSPSLQQRRGSWASILNNRSCQASQLQLSSSSSNSNNNASLQKQVIMNSNNLKQSNNSSSSNSNISLNSTASTDNCHHDAHQNTASSVSQMHPAGSHNSNNMNASTNKCSTIPVVPLLRASDLNSSATSSSTKRNKSSSSTSSSSSSSSFSSLNNQNNSIKCNKKNHSGVNNTNLNGVNKRLLDIALLNSSNSCNNEDSETSSTNTDSSSSHDDCDKDEKHNDNIDSACSQNNHNQKYNSRQSRNRNNYDNIKKTDNSNKNNNRRTAGGSVSSLEGDDDESNEHLNSAALISTAQSSSSSGSSHLLPLVLTLSSSLSNSSSGVYPNNKKLQNRNNLRRNANENTKLNKNISEHNINITQGMNTPSNNSNKQQQSSVSGCSNRQEIKLNNGSNTKNSGGSVGNTLNGNNVIGRNKDKGTLAKRRPVNDKINSVMSNASTVLPHANKDLTNPITPPPINTVRATFSDVVARTTSGPVSGLPRLPSAPSSSCTSSGLPSSLVPSLLSSTSSCDTINSTSSLGPIGSKKSGRDLIWLDQQSGSSSPSSLNPGGSLFSLDQKNGSSLSQVQNCGTSVCGTGWSNTVNDSGTAICSSGSGLGISVPCSNILKALRETERQPTQPVFKETWPSVNAIWEPQSMYPPSSSTASSAPKLPVGGPVCSMWGSEVWAPPSAPWAPPGLAPRPPVINTTISSGLASDIDVLEYHPFRSLSNIWSPTPSSSNIWQPPTTK